MTHREQLEARGCTHVKDVEDPKFPKSYYTYKDFTIEVYTNSGQMAYEHKEYDGAPDSVTRNMLGYTTDIEQMIDDCDFWEEMLPEYEKEFREDYRRYFGHYPAEYN